MFSFDGGVRNCLQLTSCRGKCFFEAIVVGSSNAFSFVVARGAKCVLNCTIKVYSVAHLAKNNMLFTEFGRRITYWK